MYFQIFKLTKLRVSARGQTGSLDVDRRQQRAALPAGRSRGGTMPAYLLDGVATAARLCDQVRAETARLKAATGMTATLAVVLVGDDPASQVYVKSKSRKAEGVGISAIDYRLPADATQAELLRLIGDLNGDARVHGILVQLPLPDHMNAADILAAVDPRKDVDGFHPLNVGLLASGNKTEGFVPCTPLGSLFLLQQWFGNLAGLNAVIVGRSTIVGRPMAQLLLQENCTVTIAHSKTDNLARHCCDADILIAAVGKPNFVRCGWVKPGAAVIDVGINRVTRPDGASALVGDVAYDEVAAIAGAITPVPGGVGPMTIACLLANTALSACRHAGVPQPQWMGEERPAPRRRAYA
jgi:methylenetetrahydrofolate dehydrogenase (NADP+) / methenyltetrahydrofolate cyclohydrolase